MKVDVIWLQQIVSSSLCSTVQADKSDVYLLPNELDEKVGKVHNSVRTAESSSSCRHGACGPFKSEHHRFRAVKFSRDCCRWQLAVSASASPNSQRLNEEVAILDPLVIDAAVKVFARSVARKCCYRQVSLAKKPEFSTTFLSANPRWVMLVSARFCAPMLSRATTILDFHLYSDLDDAQVCRLR